MCLIAEDMMLDRADPQVRVTLESSREFGVALFPMPDEMMKPSELENNNHLTKKKHSHMSNTSQIASVTRGLEKHSIVKPAEQQILNQLPRLIHPYIKSVYDPPRYGNCGFYAIANALRCNKEDSYVLVCRHLREELINHRDIHEQLISTPPAMQSRRVTRRTAPAAIEIVDDLLHRLQPQGVKCGEEYWMLMPYLGYVIASVYECPVVLFHPIKSACYTFFPYRTPPNKNHPILLAFVDGNHFTNMSAGSGSVPLPEIYGDSHSPTITATKIPDWIRKYERQLDMWAQSD